LLPGPDFSHACDGGRNDGANGDAWTYKVDTSPEARMALHLAHVLLVFDLGLQNDYFDLDLESMIEPRFKAVASVWQES